MSLIPLSGLLKTASAGFSGYGEDKETAIKELLQQNALKRQATQDAIENALKQAQTRNTNAEADAPKANTQGAANYQVGLQRSLIPGDIEKTVGMGRAMIPVKVDEAAALRPGKVGEAVDIAKGEVAPHVDQAIQIAKGTPETKSPVVTTNTLPSGETQQHVSAFGTKTGTVTDTGAQAKTPGGAAGNTGERSGMAAAFLSRLKMGKADFDNGMKFIKDTHARLSQENNVTPFKMAESATANVQPSPDAHGIMGILNNGLGAFASGAANTQLAKDDPNYLRYVNLLNSMSLAMTEVLPRPTQQILGIEKGINTAKAGDSPERIADIQHRLDKAYEYLFSDPEGMLRKGQATEGGSKIISRDEYTQMKAAGVTDAQLKAYTVREH